MIMLRYPQNHNHEANSLLDGEIVGERDRAERRQSVYLFLDLSIFGFVKDLSIFGSMFPCLRCGGF
jgi:hypothetical protein